MKRSILLACAALAVLAFWATTAGAGNTPCTSALGAVTINGNVNAGLGCDLSTTTVNGNVFVSRGGSLVAFDATISGNVLSRGATAIQIEGGTIGGNVEIENGGASILVGFATIGGNVQVHNNSGGGILNGTFALIDVVGDTVQGDVGVYNNAATSTGNNIIQVVVNGPSGPGSIGGNLEVHNNQATGGVFNDVAAWENLVGGNLQFHNNAASGPSGSNNLTLVGGNTVANNLNCHNDNPAATNPVFGPNIAGSKMGECANL